MKPFLNEQYGKLLALKNPPTEKSAVRAITEQWEQIVYRVGQPRFARAIARCVAEMEFFPSVPQLEDKIPSGDGPVRCKWCQDSDGFIVELRPYPNPPDDEPDKMHRVARKCKHGS